TRAAGADVIAADFAHHMLARGRQKLADAALVQADALCLPFSDGAFAGALCGFGLRNLPDAGAGLMELRRVLQPRARLGGVDFFRRRRAVTRLVQAVYNRQVLPLVGGLVSGDRAAYQYLADSIERFVSLAEAEALARAAGFRDVNTVDMTLGVAGLLVAEV